MLAVEFELEEARVVGSLIRVVVVVVWMDH